MYKRWCGLSLLVWKVTPFLCHQFFKLGYERCEGQAEALMLLRVLLYLFFTIFMVEKADSLQYVEGNMVRIWRATFCKEGTLAVGTILVQIQKVVGLQRDSCRARFSWSSISSDWRESALAHGQIFRVSVENSVMFLTRNGFSMHSKTCFPRGKSPKRVWKFFYQLVLEFSMIVMPFELKALGSEAGLAVSHTWTAPVSSERHRQLM